MTLLGGGASVALANGFTNGPGGAKLVPCLEIILRHVPEGFEFLAVFATVVGSLSLLVLLGKWWER